MNPFRLLAWGALLALAAVSLAPGNCAADDQEKQSNSYFDGRLLVLDQYRMDGSHRHDYLLLTAAEQIISLEASEQLEVYQTNDALRVWVKDDESSRDSNRLTLETQQYSTSSGSVVVDRIQRLKKDWVIPADSADVWGDGLYTKDDLDGDLDNAGPVKVSSSSLSSSSSSVPSVSQNSSSTAALSGDVPENSSTTKVDVELQTILAQSLQASQQDTSSSYRAPPYGKTVKVVTDMSMIVYVVSICDKGGGPATTAQTWNKAMMQGNLSSFASACSNGIGYMSTANSRVIDVPLGCSGTLASTGDSWTSDSCSGDNLMRIAYAADEYALFTLKINPRKYRHHVVVLPPNLSSWMGEGCDWAGTAVMGFSAPAWTYLWVSGDNWDQPQLYMHEIGHNYMLGHSDLLAGPPTTTTPSQEPHSNMLEHGDWSSLMGYCCVLRCFHAAHMWQMGWAQALAVLDKTQLNPGTTMNYVVPAPSTTRRSFVTVTTNWVQVPVPQMEEQVLVSSANVKYTSGGTLNLSSDPPPPAPKPANSTHTPPRSPPSPSPSVIVRDPPLPPPSPSPVVLVSLQSESASDDGVDSNPAPPPSYVSNTTSVFLSPHTFWISWRPSNPPYDQPPAGYADGLLIHLYDGTSQSDVQETFFQARLQLNHTSIWTDQYYGSGLVIRLIGISAAGANVSICRVGATAENTVALCTDGLDNDCDGVADGNDPACAGLMPPPTPPVPTSLPKSVTQAGISEDVLSPTPVPAPRVAVPKPPPPSSKSTSGWNNPRAPTRPKTNKNNHHRLRR